MSLDTTQPGIAAILAAQTQADISQTDSANLGFIKNKGVKIIADSGWTANNTVGDKTAALSSYTNGLNGTMVTALNVVSGGTGTALSAAMDVIVILVKKVAALETVLAASKLPNA